MSSNKSTTACITGGGGFVGCCLAKELLEHGFRVKLLDVTFLKNQVPAEANCIHIDVRNKAALTSAVAGADVVFHLVGYGMSGPSALNRDLVEEINVQGTRNVIDACVATSTSRLIYASSVNVVAGGQEIHNGTEDSLPYFPLEKHVDNYSRSKSIAEQLVLGANGSKLMGSDKGIMRTCALRMSGVYGPGEQRHQSRIENYCSRGFFLFTYGRGKTATVDFTSGENAAQAFRKADMALKPENNHIAADGFQFYRPLCEVFSTFPSFRLPYTVAYILAFFIECLFYYLILPAEKYFKTTFDIPSLTRVEVNTMGVTHYFSIEKAKKELGYQPTNPNDIQAVVKALRTSKKNICD